LDIAIVGLPAAGKTTVFRALTAGHGSTSAGARGENLGVVKIPDERLEKLARLVGAKKVTPLEVTVHDLPPLFVRGAAPSGEAAETLSRADALIHVVRAFERDDLPHPAGSLDAERDIAAFDAELMLNDLGIIERRLEKLDITVRSARPGEREAGERERALLDRCKSQLEGERPLREVVTGAEDLKGLSNFGLVSLKPGLVVLNLDENRAGEGASLEGDCEAARGGTRTACAALCAKLEAELAELGAEDAAEFRQELGVTENGSSRLLGKLMQLLGLITFFTAGEKETRAWTVAAGGSALQAAGRIHTDIERGFIRAEVIGWEELLEFGSSAEARKHGRLRTEGKQYIVQEGDVINVLFNV
jgi:GTP-binding protein YchF